MKYYKQVLLVSVLLVGLSNFQEIYSQTLLKLPSGRVISYIDEGAVFRDMMSQTILDCSSENEIKDKFGNVVANINRVSGEVTSYSNELLLVRVNNSFKDINGSIIGTVESDGTIKDNNGHIIGTFSSSVDPFFLGFYYFIYLHNNN